MSGTTDAAPTTAGPTGGDPPADPPAGPPAGPTAGSGFWPWLRALRVVRGPDHWVGGVCAAVAARLGIDPLLVRVLAVVLALLGGLGLLAYAAAWLLLPDGDGRIEAQEVLRGNVSTSVVIALSLAAVAALVPAPWQWWAPGVLVGPGDVLGALVVTALLVALVVWLPQALRAGGGGGWAGGRPGAPGRRREGAPLRWGVLGLALAASGLTWWALASTGVPAPLADLLPGRVRVGPVSGPTLTASVLAVATLVLAAGVLLAGLRGRSGSGVSGLAVTAALAAVVALFVPPALQVDAVGGPAWAPTDLAAAQRGYGVLLGGAELDLRRLPRPAGGRPVVVPVRALFGDVRVRVPEGVDVEVRSRVGAGRAGETGALATGWSAAGREGGLLPAVTTTRGDGDGDDGGAGLVVDVVVGAGQVSLVGAGSDEQGAGR